MGAIERVADRDDERAAGGVRGGQPADAGVAQQRERPARRAGDASVVLGGGQRAPLPTDTGSTSWKTNDIPRME